MSASVLVKLLLLEEARRIDMLRRRRKRFKIRSLRQLSTDKDYIRIYRLNFELIKDLEHDLAQYLPPEPSRSDGVDNRTKPSASRAIRAVVNALAHPGFVKKHIRLPHNVNERSYVKERFFKKFHIPDILGCIDSFFVTMVRPKEDDEQFNCGEGYHSRKLTIITDSDLNILYVDVKHGGATQANFIFENSTIRTHLEKLTNEGETLYLLGDSKYTQRPYVMTPYGNPKTDAQKYYNKLHNTAKNTAEKTYKVLKARFKSLLVHRVFHYDPDMVAKIATACCVLHNICNRSGLPVPSLEEDLRKREMEVLNKLKQNRSNDLDEECRFRDELADRLWCER
ncbi:putative nuclease HARBI1 [Bicyclus anynana]|uniref:Nuclease HARBI1 n=1 Tax=Bicyclus anynana TaxID=110368 RepID=A0A6J1P526_BICAN|nr:putative nuclease HARBI1 [Bicyclus anynana]